MSDLHIDVKRKPTSVEEFRIWMKAKFGYDEIFYPNYYGVATKMLKDTFEKSPFWRALSSDFSSIDAEYKIKHNASLFSKNEIPEIFIKSLDSLLNKVYRKDVLNNENFPDPPKEGWVNQMDWFLGINDILRTTIVVKYLDGVEFLIGKIKDIAQSQNCTFEASLEAREEGYYAAHLGVKQELTLIDERYTPTSHLVNVEIQITTELQSLIKDLLHRYYEANRIKHNVQNSKWQWDYLCDEFNSNYLGHIVHYVEGKIVELRDKQ